MFVIQTGKPFNSNPGKSMIEAARSVLSRSWAYQSFWHAIGGDERNRVLLREYIRPAPGDRVLDIGCGPGTMVPYLPGTEYVGLDVSAEYIERARRRFPQARFVCQGVGKYDLVEPNCFDIVLGWACSITSTTVKPWPCFRQPAMP
jgi:SAM-dependent methyltransferase